MTKLPRRVSVIVPTCNRPALLREALASIRALEGETYAFEILVGDNGSAPETQAAAEEFGALHIKVERTGAGAARNAGLMAATGDYLAFLDDDDAWLPGHLRDQLSLLDARPELEAVIGQVIYADYDLNSLSSEPHPTEMPQSADDLLRRMLSGYFPQIGTLVARASLREAIGPFDETLLGGQDLDWMLRIARRRTLAFAPVPCVQFRGRPYGTYDALQLRRIKFDRTVFLRHALPERRLWQTPIRFLRAYEGTLRHFYHYFVDAAVTRSAEGDRPGTFRAIAGAFRVFPLRASYHLIAPKELRKALLTSLLPWRARMASAQKARGDCSGMERP